MKRHISNIKPYPVELSESTLAPGDSATVEDDPRIQTLIEAGILADQDIKDSEAEPDDEAHASKRTRHSKTEDNK